MRNKLISLIMVFSLLILLAGCGEKVECVSVVEDFEQAWNAKDVEAILNCIDPAVADPIKVGVNLLGKLTDATEVVIEAILTELVGELPPESDIKREDIEQSCETMILDVEDIYIDENNAIAYTDVMLNIVDVEINRYAEIYLIKKNDQWYIDKVKFVEN